MSFIHQTFNKHQPLIRQFSKFAVVGFLGTLIDFGLLNLFVKIFRLGVYYSATLSFIAAVFNNFFLNKHWTFKNDVSDKKTKDQFWQFLLVSLIGLGLNLLIMYLIMDIFGLGQDRYNWAKAGAVIVVLIWNFWANKLWTFKEKNG